MHYTCPTDSDTERIGREIARSLAPDAVVHGGEGRGGGGAPPAPAQPPLEGASPSFAIVHEYPLPAGPPLIHIDGYRLSENRREWFEIGIPELLAGPGVKLIEWPKQEFESFEESHVEVHIAVRDDGTREIEVG